MQIFEEWYFRPWYWLAVQNPKATKAHALEKLAKITSVPMQEITVFGDQSNDISMFKTAGTAIAVSNAIPKLIELANKTIESNIKDGVIKYLLRQ